MSNGDTLSIERPSLTLLGAEPFRAAIEFARHKLGKSDDTKPGDGHPVVIFPGLGAHGGSSTMDPTLSRRLRTPLPLRTASIYSRSDGVLAWQTGRHVKRSCLVHEIEVGGSHVGMGWNREVLAAVADRLGQEQGPRRRHVRAP
jgi:hypothetical protein